MRIIDSILARFYKGDNELNILNQRYLPRWIVVLIDTFLCTVSLALVYLILYRTPVFFTEQISIPLQAFLLIGVHVLFFYSFKTYSGIIRHSTFTDILKLAFASSATFISVFLFNYIYELLTGALIFSVALLFLYALLSFVLLLLFRVMVKEFYQIIKNNAKGVINKRVVIIGVEDQNISLAKALTTESDLPFTLVGFITKKTGYKRYKLLGKPVIPMQNNFDEIIEQLNIQGVLIIGESLTAEEKNTIVEHCLKRNIEIFNVPVFEKWDSKADIRAHIKPIQIEDLLERETIGVQNEAIEKDLHANVILVTGGAGSIGSEIVKQVAAFNPKLLIILDQAESALHELDLYLQENYPNLKFITELANISNMYRLEQLYEKHKFKVIYHAAAYKHVPLIERNPHEAIFVNILGTVNLAVLAVRNKVDKFVMVSTDKAVNPTNVMGASKRVAEMYVQSLQLKEGVHTRFITTRFGNVLGSNGSVIPHFRKQIKAGGPLTVTHKDIIRYFMTIPEACQLVLQAGTMGQGGEIFVFDMGEPIKILDMAKRMIRLSGFEPYKDIDIKITGLRPGEKLYEELLNDSSITMPTHHPKIMIITVPTVAFEDLSKKIKQLVKVAAKYKDKEVVTLLKEIVPEYKSENSIYEILDKK